MRTLITVPKSPQMRRNLVATSRKLEMRDLSDEIPAQANFFNYEIKAIGLFSTKKNVMKFRNEVYIRTLGFMQII